MLKIDPQKLSLTERIEKLTDMITEGRWLEAFEKFYAEDIVRQETDHLPIKGKDACRIQEEKLVTCITDFKSSKVLNLITDKNVSVIKWEFNYIHRDLGEQKYTQTAMQIWNCDGEITTEIIHKNN
ncbi:hypothetical protein [Plebeiibacterium sediminum]|uniref:Nuclear transport factor 2 family protein n=1 Tax=Plebeiibacterium sediminum TaxID=2992112 RepID=A0AAE3SIE2_9BACT|nr:hypothetical protein [Plebeiobacterium sediminum]MCW3789138.1 hypothetical protein [Plebeiobacterium sediminum]